MIDDDWWWLVMMMLLMVIRITDSSMFLFNIGCSRPFWFEYERHTLSFSEDCFLLRPGVTEIVSMTCGWKRFHQRQKMVELQWFKCMIPKMSQKMVWHPTILWLKGPPPETPIAGKDAGGTPPILSVLRAVLRSDIGPGMSSESIHVIRTWEKNTCTSKPKQIPKETGLKKNGEMMSRKVLGCKQMIEDIADCDGKTYVKPAGKAFFWRA